MKIIRVELTKKKHRQNKQQKRRCKQNDVGMHQKKDHILFSERRYIRVVIKRFDQVVASPTSSPSHQISNVSYILYNIYIIHAH